MTAAENQAEKYAARVLTLQFYAHCYQVLKLFSRIGACMIHVDYEFIEELLSE